MFSRICTTMAGEELSRTYNCGTDPNRYVRTKLIVLDSTLTLTGRVQKSQSL